jgi:hypothetical protein
MVWSSLLVSVEIFPYTYNLEPATLSIGSVYVHGEEVPAVPSIIINKPNNCKLYVCMYI